MEPGTIGVKIFTIGVKIDVSLGVAIEELTHPIKQIIEVKDLVSDVQEIDLQALADGLARSLAPGESAGIVFDRRTSDPRLFACVSALVTHFTGSFPCLMTIDGPPHVNYIIDVDRLSADDISKQVQG